MKKSIIGLLLAFVMLFSGVMIACKTPPSPPDYSKEIDLTVQDDSKDPQPTYSSGVKSALKQALVNFGADSDEAKEIIEDMFLPICKKAKISEASLQAVADYCKENKTKINKLIESVAYGEQPDDMEAYLKSYYALIKGAFEVLKADDIGKLAYELMAGDSIGMYDTTTVAIVKDIGRDNFIILSRFMFKIIGLSLEKQEGMIDMMMGLMTTVTGIGYYDDIPYAEIVEMYLMDIEMMYEIYQTVTDNEINKLIDIFVDGYASVNKRAYDNPISALEKTELKDTCKSIVAECRPIVTLVYKASKRINKKTLANYIKNEDETIAYYMIGAVLDAYDNDLDAAEKTKISALLKNILTNAQYYEETKEETYRDDYGRWYDSWTDEYVYQYEIRYEIVMEKTAQKHFTVPEEYLNDPIAMLKELRDAVGRKLGGVNGNLTEKEQALLDMFADNANAFGIAALESFYIPTEDITLDYSWEWVEERIPATEIDE